MFKGVTGAVNRSSKEYKEWTKKRLGIQSAITFYNYNYAFRILNRVASDSS